MKKISSFFFVSAVCVSSSLALADARASDNKPTVGKRIEQSAGELQDDVSRRLHSGDQTHEISAAGSGLAFGGDLPVSFNFTTAYSYLLRGLLEDNIQATASVGLNLTENNTVINAMVGPTFNYKLADKKLENAMFATALIGMAYTHVPDDGDAQFAYNVSVGKRFGINDFVTWKPSIGLGKGATFAKDNVSFLFVPIQFSFFL